MGEIAFTVPLLPGKRAAFEELCRTLQGPRSKDVREMLGRHGSSKESWFLDSRPDGDVAIVYWEAEPTNKPWEAFAASKHAFDLWLKEQLRLITGLDMNHPPNVEFPRQVFRSGY